MSATLAITDCYDVSVQNQWMDKEKRQLEFAERFNELLAESGLDKLTRIEQGKKFGVTGPAVSYWANGDRLPTVEQAMVIAEVFDCNIEWLLMGRGQKRGNYMEQDPRLSRIWSIINTARMAADASGKNLTDPEFFRLCRFCLDPEPSITVSDEELYKHINKMLTLM